MVRRLHDVCAGSQCLQVFFTCVMFSHQPLLNVWVGAVPAAPERKPNHTVVELIVSAVILLLQQTHDRADYLRVFGRSKQVCYEMRCCHSAS